MKRILNIITLICFVSVSGLISRCANIPTDAQLEISKYDKKPDIKENISFPENMQGGDSIVVCFSPSSKHGDLEFAYRIKLTDYTATTIFSSFDKMDTLVISGLSDNIKKQRWQLSIIGRYPGNVTYADTVDYLFNIRADLQSVQLAPSFILINPSIDSCFYLDINLDDIADSILAGELCLCFDSYLVEYDTVVFPVSDSLYYFLSGKGDFINFTKFNSSSGSITFDFAFSNGKVDGLPGTGKIIRVYFIAKRPGVCEFSLVNGKLKDINNYDVSVELTSASTKISYMEY